jgi:2-polyprenyl-6-methoxyphenol hydroxylase-like FAD-dependent oxidoreductase
MVQAWAATYPSTEPPPRDEWGVAPASQELQAILDQFPTTHPIHALANHTTPNRLLHFGLFYRKHKSVWHKGRTCLLGDSCHATLPYVGQGANQAIEDSIVLANCLSSETNYNAAFDSYYQQRNKRTKRVVRIANIMNKLHHTQNPLLIKGREFLFESFLKGNFMAKMIEKEIVEECPVKDYAKYK